MWATTRHFHNEMHFHPLSLLLHHGLCSYSPAIKIKIAQAMIS